MRFDVSDYTRTYTPPHGAGVPEMQSASISSSRRRRARGTGPSVSRHGIYCVCQCVNLQPCTNPHGTAAVSEPPSGWGPVIYSEGCRQ